MTAWAFPALVREFSTALTVARAELSPTAVHELRRAGRKVDVALRLGGVRALRDDLHALTRALGPVRDLDVVAELALDARFSRWLARRREVAARRAHVFLTQRRFDDLVRALRSRGVEAPGRASLHALTRAATAARRDVTSLDSLHAFRRAARRARLAAELLGEPRAPWDVLQHAAGEVVDLARLAALLRQWGQEAVAPAAVKAAEFVEQAVAALTPRFRE
jgi:CHAD domain-containing protein